MLEKFLQLFVKTIHVGLNIEKLINIQNGEYIRGPWRSKSSPSGGY